MWYDLFTYDTTHSYLRRRVFMCDITCLYVWLTHSRAWHDASSCAITCSARRHDLFIGVAWLIHMCDMPHCGMTHTHVWHASFRLYVWQDSLIGATCLIHMSVTCLVHMCDDSVTWLVHMCDMTHLYVRWLVLLCDATQLHVWPDSFIYMCDMTHSFICGTWLIHIYLWHDAFTCMTWLIHFYAWHDTFIYRWDMTHSFVCVTWLIHVYLWHDAFTCVTWLIHL